MLPFTAEILFSSFAQYNSALWPAHLLVFALALGALLATLRPVRGGDRAIAALLVAAWLWTGLGYHFIHFATLNFAAPLYGVFFVLQAMLLAWTGLVQRRLVFRFRPDLSGWAGLALALAAMIAWPLADALGHGWQSVRLVGLAPDATTVFTLGLLLLVERRTPLHLVVIPLLWTLVAGATAWVLSIPQDLALPVAGLGALCLMLWRNRRQKRW